MITDRAGLPLPVAISGANTHDSQALQPLVRGIPPIRSRRGPRRRKPAKLHGDKGYDGQDFLFTTGANTAKARNLWRDPRASLCVADDAPPFAYVEVRGDVTLGDDPAELYDVAYQAGARYMGQGRAEEFGRRNGVPGELVVRLCPTKVITFGGITD